MVDLLVVLTKDVYTVLDELISDTQFTIQHQSDAKNQSMGMVSSRLSFQQQQESLEKDMLYLLKMKAMDEEILKSTSEGGLKVSKGLEMTDVVPVGGLVMAHLHVLECELRTALDIWTPNQPAAAPKFVAGKVVQVTESPEFDSFTGGASTNSVSLESDFVESVLHSRPSVTSSECIKVILIRRSEKNLKALIGEAKDVKEVKDVKDVPPQSRIRLGSFRIKQ